ncbi:DUF397 domain-containing protein [Actinomadura violacea]|uniref:DUF397 domain-containing protein n=1 Tax=Actinomadura violacea TaxID=2819934 RepID=A0ABS3RMP9_9ACTN|nr:DUF397 domain-containing protein [Actinomadura violacea]MBO2458008.1 DUF397 domain-containing protein [Actinomadura violacea]
MTVHWRKSSHSGTATDEVCVELGRLDQGIGVRDSKDPDGGYLTSRLRSSLTSSLRLGRTHDCRMA